MMNEPIKWNGYEFFPPKGQEVFYSTEWFTHKATTEKNNNSFECLWRIVDTGSKITGNLETSSIAEGNANILECENVTKSNETCNISELSATGSQAPMGSPKQNLTLTPANSDLLKLPSLDRVRSDNNRLTIAYDCEFYYEPAETADSGTRKKNKREHGQRNITSYQFALYAKDGIHVLEVVFIVKPVIKDGKLIYKRLALSQCIGSIMDICTTGISHSYTVFGNLGRCIIDTSNVKAAVYNNHRDKYMVARMQDVTILCHSGIADLSAFAAERNNDQALLSVTSIQGGLVSLKDVYIRSPHRTSWKFYACMVVFRDTMCYSAPGKKSLKSLGEALAIPKVELPNGAIENMGSFLNTNREKYLEYASNDALITLVYASRMWGINKEMPVTASSAAAQGAYLAIRDYMGLGSKEEYQLAYSGIKEVIKGKEPMKNSPGYLKVTNMEPYDHGALLLLTAAAQSYKGGFNGCTQVGWFDGDTYYDYDLQNAYPTSMCSVYDIDFRDGINPLEFAPITERYLTLEDFNTPYDPLYAYISFEFPEGTRYPCIPISHEGSLVFPRTSAGFEGVYACGPDIYRALKMGARVYCQAGYRGRIRRRADGSPSQSLRETVFQLVQDRNTAKKIYGKGSIEELILKIMVNSIYGKTAQNVIVKHTWDGANQEYKDLGASIVTCPAHAAIITAGVRCVLIAAMTQLEQKGYQVYSVTTDGFISNAPLDVLSSLDLFGFADVFKEARLYLTAGQSDAMWEPKHTMTRFLNLGTRANVSPDDGGVCAHGGLVTGCIPDTLEDRVDYIRKVITRTGTVPSPHIEFANLKTLVMKSEDFHTYDCTTNISFDFDMKRKPMETTLRSVWVDAESGNYTTAADALPGYYEMACFDTEAFASIAEYEKYRTIKSGCEVLRTTAQWKKFFVKAKCPAGSKNRVTDTDWSILMSCIIGYRHNILKIEPLDRCETTKDKLEYINAHNNTGNVFTENHWKNARRPERKTQMLPIEAIEEALLQLREECAA